jgi:hypothetical protein
MALGRTIRITLGLVGASGIVGGLCGVLALVPILVLRIVHPNADDAFIPLTDVAPLAFTFGAVLGGVLGPLVAWTALRHVPLWRLLLEPAVGTVPGALIGWSIPHPIGVPRLIVFPLIGMAVAALRLRYSFPVRRRQSSEPTRSNER